MVNLSFGFLNNETLCNSRSQSPSSWTSSCHPVLAKYLSLGLTMQQPSYKRGQDCGKLLNYLGHVGTARREAAIEAEVCRVSQQSDMSWIMQNFVRAQWLNFCRSLSVPCSLVFEQSLSVLFTLSLLSMVFASWSLSGVEHHWFRACSWRVPSWIVSSILHWYLTPYIHTSRKVQ